MSSNQEINQTMQIQARAAFQRRLRRALADLGAPVPRDWLQVTEDGNVTFGDLDHQSADGLVWQLEELAEAIEAPKRKLRAAKEAADAHVNQLVFDFAPATHIQVAA